MSTAVAKFNGGNKAEGRFAARRQRAVGFVRQEKTSSKIMRVVRRAAVYGAFAAALLTLAGAAVFLYFYTHYAAVVDQRLKSGFWHSRAGIYAAPFVLRREQKTSPEATVEMLRRAGYVESATDDEIWNGTFARRGDVIEVKTNEAFNAKYPLVELKFEGGRLASIAAGKKQLDEYDLEPEMLTGRTETKRGRNHVLRYADIPENLRRAILTAEDQRFFEHAGIDPRGVGRALVRNFHAGAVRQGGSTITQQLVKNTFLSPERSFARKFSEAFLALALERKMSKEDSFAVYCNEIYLGQYGSTGVHGIEQAARVYFDKDLKDLNLAESAAIAAMIKNPNRFAPHRNAPEASARRAAIVDKMAELGLVARAEAETAKGQTLALAPPRLNDKTIAPYFVDAATRELQAKFESDYLNTNFNMRVYTTIDTQLQSLAEAAVAEHLARLDRVYAKKGMKIQATVVALDPHTGHVLALVGGRDYRESQFNRATDAQRQPGSTFKPFVYAAAFERGMTPMTVAADRPTDFAMLDGKSYQPANYGDAYANQNITLKTALAKSSNVVAVKTALDTGLRSVALKAEDFGFENVEPYPSLALGAMETTPLRLAAAYAAFANGGRRVEPTFIDRIVSGEEKAIYEARPAEKQIIGAKTAYMLTDMLQAVVERGTARSAAGALGRGVAFAGKTGSSKDGWFVGYTPNLVTVAWIGFDESVDIRMTGGEAALPLWTSFMKAAVEARPEFGGAAFPMPAGLTSITIDPETGMLADDACPQRETVVVPTSAASGARCLKHQPLPETYLAAATDAERLSEPQTADIEPAVQKTVEPEIEANDPVYREVQSAPVQTEPIEKSRPVAPKKPDAPVKRSFYEDFEKQSDEESR